MRHPVLTAVLALTALGDGAALADDDCDVPMTDWQPRSAVQQMAESKGWTVRRIKTDDGCYEIKGRNAKGDEIKVKVHPATLEILKIETEGDDEEDDENSSASTPGTQGAAPGENTAPTNRLLNGNAQPLAVVQ